MNPLAVYIHYPFCLSLCPYCDFNVYTKRLLTEEEFLEGIQAEIELLAKNTKAKITSIFFGGGTPSLLNPNAIEKIILTLNKKFTFDDAIEISLEANPENAEGNYLSDIMSSGIARLSLGVQALNDEDLTFLGRNHNKTQAIQAIERARNTFKNLSFDLIYARPTQAGKSLAAWREELTQALTLAPQHLSLYCLEIAPRTAFYKKQQKKEMTPLDPEKVAELWLLSQNLCADFGLKRYEISNYAKEGFQSKHNLSYWLYHDYIGLGPGAHGRIKTNATLTPKNPKLWYLSAKQNDFNKHFQCLALTDEERQKEKLIMGLRLTRGIKMRDIETRGIETKSFPLSQTKINQLVQLDLLKQEKGILKTTDKGALVLDNIIAELL